MNAPIKNLKSINTKLLGKKGEDLAIEYYLQKGYQLITRNYRYRRGEIDLIFEKSKCLVFVEVKLRKHLTFGHPEEFVTNNQQRSIINTADHYLQEPQWEGNIRFDIIAINAQMEITHFEDAFY